MKSSSEQIVLRALSLAMLLQFAVGGAIFPFVSIYLHDQGLDYRQISRIYSVSSAALIVFPFLWGMLADRFIPLNRLFTLMNLMALGALWMLSRQAGFSGLLLSVTVFIACFNPTLMLLNPLCFHHLRDPREQFGQLRAWGSLGWMVPSVLIFGWLAWREDRDLQFILWLAMGLTAAMAVMTVWLPHTAPGAAHAGPGVLPRLSYGAALGKLLRNRSYVTIVVAFFLMAGSFSIYGYYSSPRLEQLGMAREWLGPVQCIGVVLEIVLFRWRSLFLHRMSYASTIVIGCLALVLRQLCFAFVDNLWVLSASFLLVGIVVVFFHIGASVLVNALAGAEVRSTAQTLLVLCGSGLGPLFGNWMVGFLTGGNTEDLRPVFLFAAGLAGLACLLIVFRGPRLDRDARQQG